MNKMTTGIKFLPEKINPLWKILTILSMLLMVGFSNSQAQIILASSTPTSITITWTAPGDDDYTGTATSYDIRYSTSVINEGNWGAASQAFGEPSPKVASSTETYTINGLLPNTNYYIAIKTADEIPNWSIISNVLQAATQDDSGGNIEAPITGSIVVDSVNGSATLSCFTVVSANTPVYQFALDINSNFPTPLFQTGSVSGNVVLSTFSGLDNLTTYYWHCRAIDPVLNDTSTWSTTRTFTFNSPPNPPVNYTPADNETITSEPFTLVVNNGSDNDGDPLTYHFYLSTNNTFTNIVDSVVNVTEESPRTSAVFNSYTPINGQQYWWRCRVFDGVSFSNYSTTTNFTYVDLSSGNECLTPPGLPSLQSPANGTGILSGSPQLCITNSIPNQGCTDPQVYTFELYADASLSSLVAVNSNVAEGLSSTCTNITTLLQGGKFYYWRVKCSNGSAESNWAGPFYFHTPNNLPPTPGLVAPENGGTVTTLTPTLSITGVNDPDGTDVTYEFEVSISSSFSSLSSAGQVNDTASIINWVVSDPLTNNSLYYWRVRATDGIGYSAYSITRTFNVESSNQNAPQAPQVQNPSEGSTVSSLNPVLIVLNGVDNEGDPLTYDFQVFNQSGVTQVAAGFGITEGTTITGWTVTTPLTNGLSYQWRARCSDGIYYSNWTSLTEFSVDLGVIINNPPMIPTHVSPTNGETVIGTPIVLTIENSIDPENDIVTYDFFMSDDPDFNNTIAWMLDVAETALETSAEFDLNLADGETYFWRVRAKDGQNVTNFSSIGYFNYVDFAASENEYTTGIGGPAGGTTILTTTPTLVANNINIAGTKNYYFEVATDTFMYNIVTFSSPIPEDEGDQTTWQVEQELETGQDYFWRVKANDYPYSPAAKIHIQFAAYAAPNPVHLGETITFVLPPEKNDLLIQTVSGETVLIQENVSDEWVWNLQNNNGTQVSVGVYLWYIAGSDAHGKVVVKP
ncbi:MAG: fibronectin type III domain-containing protein [bacterium]